MKKKIVIALGGNALGDNNAAQIKAVQKATHSIMELVSKGHQVVIVHGNGPQVGKIQLAFAAGSSIDENVESMPLPESIAMSQGYIGYHLQLALNNHFRKEKLNTDVATILTQIIVDENDLSFHNPTKPIGPFYTKEEIEQKGFDHYVEDSGRGYRQVVASPLPQSIVEVELVKRAMDAGTVVICSGGGGIPLVDTGSEFKAVDAVIDKDAAAALLAKQIDADMLVILTAVDQVALNFGKENVSYLDTVNVRELEQYITEKHFAPGSMLPKVEAAKRFVIHHKEAIAVITSLELASEAITGTKGTQIIN